MSEALGLTHSNPAVVPSISVGSIINLNNGEGGYQAMSHEFYSKIMAKPYILLPLIQGPTTLKPVCCSDRICRSKNNWNK
jgi:hypothetical protein